MNRIFISTAVAAMLASGSAFAQSAAFNWTGFYLGAYGGFGSSQLTATDIGDPAATPWYILGHQFTSAPTSFVGGGEIGYNYQFGQLVVGAEANAGYFNHNGSTLYDNTLGHSDTSIVSSGGLNSTLRGRLGVTAGRALVYATGGLAATDATAKVVSFGSFISPNSNLSLGWTIGGGMEYAVTDNWSVKVEYLHDDFGQSNVTLAGTTSSFNIRSTDDTVRLGINYLFK